MTDMSSAAQDLDQAAVVERNRWHAELEILFETVQDLASTLSSHEVVERLIERTLEHLDSEIGSVMLVRPDGSLGITYARGLPDEVVSSTRVEVGEGIAGHVVATGEPLLVPDVEQDPRFRRRNHERYYTRSCICAPLIFQGRVRGVINVNNKRSQNPYASSDLRLLQTIASHAAMALANARRFEEMEERAQRDALTNLANHGFFWSTLDAEVKRADRHERELALVIIDVDHFKAYNDRHGHRQGDSALVAVSQAIASAGRAHDLAARYGGEEFAVILPETPKEGAETFGEKVRGAVEALADYGLTVSVGVACLFDSDGTATDLVEKADAELYRAKSQGRNQVCTAG
jgi:diguanylate cyclase (GGDEF)-like protein